MRFAPECQLDYCPTADAKEIVIRPAVTEDDLEKALDVRWRGYKKYGHSKAALWDEFDMSPNCTILLATDMSGEPVGTLRAVSRRGGPLEIEKYLDLTRWLTPDELDCAEAARLSVPRHPRSELIKQSLWKGFVLYCLHRGIGTMVIWVKKGGLRAYGAVGWRPIRDDLVFTHPLLGESAHHALRVNIDEWRAEFQAFGHPLYQFFFEDDHPWIMGHLARTNGQSPRTPRSDRVEVC